jgi:GNAT superfamily N-acetyltransferase
VALRPYGLAVRIGGEICALTTWEAKGPVWYSSIVAVAPAYRRQGFATELKRTVLLEARAAGARTVESTIAYDNTAMIQANKKLGADIVPIHGVYRWSKVENVRAIIRVS